MMRIGILMLAIIGSAALAGAAQAETKPTIAIIGTGDMGDSLGPRFAERAHDLHEERQDKAESTNHRGMISRIGIDRKDLRVREKLNDFGPDGILASHSYRRRRGGLRHQR